MMTTQEYLPASPLRNFIRCYSLRVLDTEGADVPRPIHAIDESFMTFWLNKTPLFSHTPSLYNTKEAIQRVNLQEQPLLGIQSSFKGFLNFNGLYRFFCVEFIANGFYCIFHIPMCHLSDRLLHCDEVIGKEIHFLQEQLEEAGDIQEMAHVADQYFLAAHLKNMPGNNVKNINAAAMLIQNCRYSLNVRFLADRVNMSLRGLERHFMEQVGLSPKLLARVVRFNKVLQSKMVHPEKSWTDIAINYAYFDQMHLIKDFKTFTGQSPNSFLKQLPIPMREHFGKD